MQQADGVSIGLRVRRAREDRDWNQSDLARRAGVSVSYVNRLEEGKYGKPSVRYMQKIAEALGRNVADLTNGQTAPLDENLMAEVADLARGNEAFFREIVSELRIYPSDQRPGALRFIIQSLRAARNLPLNRS